MDSPLAEMLKKISPANPTAKDVIDAEIGTYTSSVSERVKDTYPRDVPTQEVPYKDLK